MNRISIHDSIVALVGAALFALLAYTMTINGLDVIKKQKIVIKGLRWPGTTVYIGTPAVIAGCYLLLR